MGDRGERVIKSASRLPLVLALFGVINGRLHKTILSDGILPQQNKIDKILYDKIPYV